MIIVKCGQQDQWGLQLGKFSNSEEEIVRLIFKKKSIIDVLSSYTSKENLLKSILYKELNSACGFSKADTPVILVVLGNNEFKVEIST